MKCSIHSNVNANCKHGDIIYNNNVLSIIIDNGHRAFILHTQTKKQSGDYVNIPVYVSQHIDDPYGFYSMLLNHDLCPHDCKVMELHLCSYKHNNFIKKYFSCDKRCRYTIIYPYIYEIGKNNSYYMFRLPL